VPQKRKWESNTSGRRDKAVFAVLFGFAELQRLSIAMAQKP